MYIHTKTLLSYNKNILKLSRKHSQESGFFSFWNKDMHYHKKCGVGDAGGPKPRLYA